VVTYTLSRCLLTIDHAVAYLQLLAPHAHAAGLAIGQKNTTELQGRGKAAGLDFAIAEECGRYNECGDYTAVYGNHLIDMIVTAPGSGTYAYKAC
jgi:hypothetical protein